ncbi:DnaJ domain-containing protein [Haloimpatiens sp. FM7330]|uniref:DnaJ domain-containing protein n=1 Tax=Haloimpatiens sp. FM7330 TaxID=3298610 RepID=UPI00362C448B
MTNPYEVLGINQNATVDEIKKAYRQLAKKYHPDQYGNNPLRDLAEERMREINEAYDYLMKNHNNNSSNNYNTANNTNYNSNNITYQTIRLDIQNNNLRDAESKLNQIGTRDAEWNFLMGVLHLRKGWYDSAMQYISTAYNLEPNNPEYRETFNRLNQTNTSYRQGYRNTHRSDSDMCDVCIKLYCADSLCECCCGGDIISCC